MRIRRSCPGGERLESTAAAQEQQGKEVLDRLDKLDADDPEFEQLVAAFIQAGRDHINFEETQVWPLLRAALTTEQADDLGSKLQATKKTAPARPHPHTPASPGVLKTAGPAVTAADRARDAASGRGEDVPGALRDVWRDEASRPVACQPLQQPHTGGNQGRLSMRRAAAPTRSSSSRSACSRALVIIAEFPSLCRWVE